MNLTEREYGTLNAKLCIAARLIAEVVSNVDYNSEMRPALNECTRLLRETRDNLKLLTRDHR